MKKYDTPKFNIVTFESEQVLLDTSNGTGANLGLLGQIDYQTDVIGTGN